MKLTPLNITLACVLVWRISEITTDDKPLFTWIWLLVLTIMLILVDILFRVWIKDNRRLWILQAGFLIVVGIVTVLIKI